MVPSDVCLLRCTCPILLPGTSQMLPLSKQASNKRTPWLCYVGMASLHSLHPHITYCNIWDRTLCWIFLQRINIEGFGCDSHDSKGGPRIVNRQFLVQGVASWQHIAARNARKAMWCQVLQRKTFSESFLEWLGTCKTCFLEDPWSIPKLLFFTRASTMKRFDCTLCSGIVQVHTKTATRCQPECDALFVGAKA